MKKAGLYDIRRRRDNQYSTPMATDKPHHFFINMMQTEFHPPKEAGRLAAIRGDEEPGYLVIVINFINMIRN